jgi:poly(A) polymerase
VRGDDLIAMGLRPGPKFGEILEAVETRQLEGALKDREEALDWVKGEFLPANNAN